MEFFGRIVMQPTDSFGLTRHASFRGWLTAMLLLLRMASGEAWNTVMHDTAIQPAATRAAGAHVLYGNPKSLTVTLVLTLTLTLTVTLTLTPTRSSRPCSSRMARGGSGSSNPDTTPNPDPNPNPNPNPTPTPTPTPVTRWERLFAEPNFVVAHAKYLGIEIYVKGLEPHRHARVLQSWQGLVESRLRKLTDVPYLGTLPLWQIRLMPKKQPLLTAQKDAQNGQGQSWLIGYDVDRERLHGGILDLTAKVDPTLTRTQTLTLTLALTPTLTLTQPPSP